MVALADWSIGKIFVQSDLHLKTLSSVYGIRWILLSTVLRLRRASSDFCLKQWCTLFRYASYWLNCLYLHDYGVQPHHEDSGDESLSFLFDFSAGRLDRSGGATIIDEDQESGVELPPLIPCFPFWSRRIWIVMILAGSPVRIIVFDWLYIDYKPISIGWKGFSGFTRCWLFPGHLSTNQFLRISRGLHLATLLDTVLLLLAARCLALLGDLLLCTNVHCICLPLCLPLL
jgi:hypothetical protein